MSESRRGSLTVVGTGIQPGHLTPETRAALERADEVLFVLADPLAVRTLRRLRPDGRSLHHLYAPGKPRSRTYEEMAHELLARVRAGARVCAAFYGHPGVLVDPARLAIAQARREGYPARMLPAVSSLDCLFADLGIDPAGGCQSYEATRFLVARRAPDPSAVLVLWQIGALGEAGQVHAVDRAAVRLLSSHLERFYPAAHETVLYEAATFPACEPLVDRVALRDLAEAPITGLSTLVVPPAAEERADEATVAALGLS